jgi:hypothetical protein
MKRTFLSLILLTIFLSSFNLVLADEVPFSVWKTKMTETLYDSMTGGYSNLYQENGEWKYAGKIIDSPSTPIDWYKKNTLTFVQKVKYTLEFYNVGELGGMKGWIWKSSYGKAKLTIDFVEGERYRLDVLAVRDDGTPVTDRKVIGDVDMPSIVFDNIIFSGGPFGKFYLETSNGQRKEIGHIEKGKKIVFSIPEGEGILDYMEGFQKTIPIKGDGFETWLEVLGEGICQDESDPTTDSGHRFSSLWGDVKVASCKGYLLDEWKEAKYGMVLHVGDMIKTGPNSGGVISFPDLTTWRMPEKTKISLKNPPQESKIGLIMGKVWINLKKMVKDGSMEVEMSEAVCGIKGTTLVLEENGEESILKVIDGEVEFTNKETGKTVMVNAGEAIMASESYTSKKKEFDVEKESLNWEEENMKKDYVETVSFKKSSSSLSTALISLVLLILIFAGFYVYKKEPQLIDKLMGKKK